MPLQKKIRKNNRKNPGQPRFSWRQALGTVLVFLALGLLAMVGYDLYCFFTQDKYFQVKRVQVVEGEQKIPAKQIWRLTSTQNIFRMDINRLAASIKQNFPDVHQATVRRIMPDTLVVEISRSLPFAQVQVKNKYYFLDSGGFIISGPKEVPLEPLPVIVGLGALDSQNGRRIKDERILPLLSLIKTVNQAQLNAPYNRAAKYNISNMREIRFFLPDVEVAIGYKDFPEKVALLKEILKNLPAGKKRVIDLRFKDAAVKA